MTAADTLAGWRLGRQESDDDGDDGDDERGRQQQYNRHDAGAGDDDDGDRSRQVAARPVSRDRGQESSLATVVEIAAPVGNQPRQGGPVQARCAPILF